MRISGQLLRSRAHSPLQSLEYLDLSNLEIVAIEKLNLCPKLQTLILRGNTISEVENLSYCSQLWKLDLGNNKVKCLDGLSSFVAIGTLTLSNNDLTWQELAKVRHLHILDLSLDGNPRLDKDPYYRLHVIDCLPNVWMLDGRIISSAERLQVEYFFQDSALADHPVRHKLSKEQFVPTSMQNIHVNGVYGDRTTHMWRRFPANGPLNIDIDYRRLKYVSFTVQEDLTLEDRYSGRNLKILKHSHNFLEELLNVRDQDKERSNMLLLLLVASLEFALPTQLVQKSLDTAKLAKMGKVLTMDLFLLPRDIRCCIVSILISAVKLDKDNGQEGGLYNKLYLCLYYTVSELIKLQHADRIAKKSPKRDKPENPLYDDYKSLLASEVVQLLCIVPVFFDYIDKDVGVMNLICTATGDMQMIDKLSRLVEQIPNTLDTKRVYEQIAEHLLKAMQYHASKLFTRTYKNFKMDKHLTAKALPKRPQSTPLHSADFLSVGQSIPDRKRVQSSKTTKQELSKPPDIGDRLLLGPQNVGRIVSLPELDIALVQMDVIPTANGSMVSTVKNSDEHFTYVDLKHVRWDPQSGFWRPLNTVGDRITIQSIDEEEDEVDDDVTPRPASPASTTASSAKTLSIVKNPPPMLKNTERKDKSKENPRPMSATLAEKLDLKLEIEPRALVTPRPFSRESRSYHQRESPVNDQGNLYDSVKSAVGNVTARMSKPENATMQAVKEGRTGASWSTKQFYSELSAKDAASKERVKSGKSNITDVILPQESDESRSFDPSLADEDEPELTGLLSDHSRPGTAHKKDTDPEGRAPASSPIEVPIAEEASVNGHKSNSTLEKENNAQTTVTAEGSWSKVEQQKNHQNDVVDVPLHVAFGSSSAKSKQRRYPSSHRGLVPASARPLSAVDAYQYILSRSQRSEEEFVYRTDYQQERTDAWKRSTRTSPVPRMGGRNAGVPPQRPTSPTKSEDRGSAGPINLKFGDKWLGGGRDLYYEEYLKRPKSVHVPGWKEGNSLLARPKSAAAISRNSNKHSKTPMLMTSAFVPSSSFPCPINPNLQTSIPELREYHPPSPSQSVRRFRVSFLDVDTIIDD
ncbi:uncharacterized protein LOC135486618 isoform X2 [Lineus longissimus]|uniref:uncharacterized protein LOC135486618 isoform X2 n=1 Tax=Lineus longissimus TaxID=88925 RepID=UPI00315DBF3E